MRILLIDDDKDDQVLFLEAVNHITGEAVCETADNGLKGFQLLVSSNELPDIIFLDLNMPLMNGRQTLDAIRSTPRFQSITIIIYSTSNSEADMKWSRSMNDKYLTKPNDFPTLIKLLRKTFHELLMTENNQRLIQHAC